MKIMVTADWHEDESTAWAVRPAVDYIVSQVEKLLGPGDLFLHAGDFGVKRGHYTDRQIQHLRQAIEHIASYVRVLAIDGNHDMGTGQDPVGLVQAFWGRGEMPTNLLGRGVTVANRPTTVKIQPSGGLDQMGAEGLNVVLLPFPDKRGVAARADGPVGEPAISEALATIVQARAAELGNAEPWRNVLVMHGTVKGGRTGSEMEMPTDYEVHLDPAAIPDAFGLVIAGHLHHPQKIASRVWVPGCIAPVRFDTEGVNPSFLLADMDSARNALDDLKVERIPIPVEHQLLSIDYREAEAQADLAAWLKTKIEGEPAEKITGAVVRLRYRVPASQADHVDEADLRRLLLDRGAYRVEPRREVVAETAIDLPDISLEMGIEPLADLWVDANPDLDPIRAELKAFAKEIEIGVPLELRHPVRGVDYEPEMIEITGWKPFRHAVIDFTKMGRVVCFAGPNGVGKSNALESEPWILHHRCVRGTTDMREVIRQGEDEVTGTLTFRCESDRYRVTRSDRLGSGGRLNPTLSLSRWDEMAGWVSASGGSGKETQQEIEKLVGSYDLASVSRFGGQGKIDEILDLKPKDLKERLQEALGTGVFDVRLAGAKSRMEGLGQDLSRTRQKIEGYRERVKNLPALRSSRDQKAVAVKECERGIQDMELKKKTILEELEKAVAAVREAAAEDRRVKDLLSTAEHDRDGILEKVETATNRLGDLGDLLAGSAEIHAKVSELEGLRQIEKKLLDWQRRLDAATAQVESQGRIVADQRTEAQQQRSTAITAAMSADQAAEQALDQVKRDIQGLEKEADRLRASAVKDAERELEQTLELAARLEGDVNCIDIEKAECAFLIHAKAARGQIERKQKTLEDHQESRPIGFLPDADQTRLSDLKTIDLVEATEAHDEASAALKRLQETVLPAVLGLDGPGGELTRLEAEQKKIRDEGPEAGPSEIERVQAQVRVLEEAGWEQKKLDLVKAETTKEGLEDTLQDLEEALSQKKMAVAELQGQMLPEDRLTGLDCEEELVRERLATHETDLATQRNDLTVKSAELGSAQGQVEETERDEQNLKRLEAAEQNLGKKHFVAQAWWTACGRDGLPYMILQRSLTGLQLYANSYMEDVGLTVELQPAKELQSGESRTEIVGRFRDGTGSFLFREAGGFQRMALSFAMRAALVRVQAESLGRQAKVLILDEGWGAFDSEMVLRGPALLHRLARDFGRVVYVTHVPEMQQAADTVVQVSRDESGSTIQIVGAAA